MGKKFYLIVILVFFSLNSIMLLKLIEVKRRFGENITELQKKFHKFKDQSSYNFGLITKHENQIISTYLIDS